MQEDQEVIAVHPGLPFTLICNGDLDLKVSTELQSALNSAEAVGDIHVDLSKVPYIDSSCYAVLVEAARRLNANGQRLALASPNRSILHILHLTGIVRYFDNQPDIAPVENEALADQEGHGWQHAAFTIPGRLNLLSLARERVMDMARSMPFNEDEISEIELAVGEALSNALRHGCPDESYNISVECEASGTSLTLRVTDPGTGFKPGDIPPPELNTLQEGGMGLHFMRLTMDQVDYDFGERGTTVELIKRAKTVAEPPEEEE